MTRLQKARTTSTRLPLFILLLLGTAFFPLSLKAQTLHVFLEASAGPILPGEPITQVVTVQNTGATALANVTVQLRHPMHTQSWPVLSPGASCPGGSCSAGELATWSFASLPAGQSRSVLMTAILNTGTAAPVADTELELSAIAQSASGSVQTSDTVFTGTATTPLRLGLSADRETAQAADTITYTLRWANTSLTAADPQVSDLVLEADLPPGTTLLSADGASVAGSSLLWDIGSTPTRSMGLQRFTVQVNTPAAAASVQARARLNDENGRRADAAKTVAITAATPLQLTFNTSADTLQANRPLTQTLEVRNTSASPIADVTVFLQQPGFVQSYPQLSAGGACPGSSSCPANALASWSLGTLPAGQSRAVQMTSISTTNVATYLAGRNLELIAMAQGNGTSDARVRHVLTTGFEQPSLHLSLAGDRETVQAGEILTYTLHTANASLTAADPQVTNLVLEAAIPPGTQLISSSANGQSTAHGTVRWPIGQVPSRASGLYRYSVRVDTPATVRELVNDVWLRDENRRLATARHSVAVAAPNSPLRIVLNTSAGSARPGEPLTQTLTVHNSGAVTAESVLIQLQQPAWSNSFPQLSTGAACPGGNCSSLEFASWSLGNIPAGQSRSMLMTSLVSSGSASPPPGYGLELNVLASATAIAHTRSRAVIPIGFSDPPLRLALTADRQFIQPNDIVNFTLDWANTSLTAADPQITSLIVEAAIPQGSTLVSAEGGTLTGHGSVRWNLGAAATRASGKKHFQVQAGSDTSRLVSTAWLQDNNGRLATQEARLILPAALAPLQIHLHATPAPSATNRPLKQTVTVHNAGSSVLEDVTVQLQQPMWTQSFPEMTSGVTCPGGSCSALELASWSLGNLAAGQSRSMQMTTLLNNTGVPGAAPLELHALGHAIAISTAITRSTQSTAFEALPSLQLAVSTDRHSVMAGQAITYSIQYINPAAASTAALTLEASIPEGASVISAHGGTITSHGTLRWSIPPLPAQSHSTRQFTVQLDGAPQRRSLISDIHIQAVDRAPASQRNVVPVQPISPLTLSFSSTPGPVLPGQAITQTATVRNDAAIALEDVRIHLQQPGWTNSFPTLTEGAVCPGGSCSSSEYAVWSFGTLAPGEYRTVQMIAVARTGSNAAPIGSILDLDVLATALVTSSTRASSHVLIGTSFIPPGDLPPVTQAPLFADGFE